MLFALTLSYRFLNEAIYPPRSPPIPLPRDLNPFLILLPADLAALTTVSFAFLAPFLIASLCSMTNEAPVATNPAVATTGPTGVNIDTATIPPPIAPSTLPALSKYSPDLQLLTASNVSDTAPTADNTPVPLLAKFFTAPNALLFNTVLPNSLPLVTVLETILLPFFSKSLPLERGPLKRFLPFD